MFPRGHRCCRFQFGHMDNAFKLKCDPHCAMIKKHATQVLPYMLNTTLFAPFHTAQAKLYFRFVGKHWRLYLWGVIFMILTSCMSIAMPAVVSWSIDLLAQRDLLTVPPFFRAQTLPDTLGALVLTAIVIQLLAFVGRIGWRQSLARATHMAGSALKISLWNAIRERSYPEFLQLRFGDLMNRATADWNYARIIFGFVWVVTLDIVLLVGFGAAAMIWIDPILAALALSTLPLAAWFSRRYAKREFVEHTRSQETLGKLSELTAHMIYSVRLQRATHTEHRWLQNLDGLADRYARERLKTLMTGLKIFPIASLPSLCAYIILLTAGILRLRAGEITLGEFIALQSYVVVIQGVLFEISQNITEWQRGFASLKRLTELMGARWTHDVPAVKGAVEVKQDLTRLQVNELAVSYPGTSNIISGISFTVQRGEWLGIHGPIGSGKSTLMNALAGILNCSDGQIYLDQFVVRDNRTLCDHTTLVSQTPHFFSGSIRFNLLLDQDLPDEMLWEVLQVVAMDVDVKVMKSGLDTEINEGGTNLSGGQKQRLALARSLLRQKAIILCDDVLSAVDVKTERLILQRLRERWKDRIVIFASHKPDMHEWTQQVLELQPSQRGAL